MTTGVNQETAKIIPFPLGHRLSAVARSREQKRMDDASALSICEFGSWYHEAAILEAEQANKPQA